MTAMARNQSELTLFITHVETEGPLLKIWGQTDRNAATCIERMILPLCEKFAHGMGLPNPNYPPPPNTICCARFQNEGYYRAKICNIQQNGNVLVHFIDYGNFEVLPPSAIRLLDNIPAAMSLHALPPVATDFILANVMPINGVWEPETVESIKQSLRYADLKGILHSIIGSHKLLKLCYNNEDFGELLVSKNVATSVSLPEMFSSRRQTPQNRPPQQSGQFTRDNNHPQYVQRSQNTQNPTHEDWRNSQQRQAPTHVPEALVFKSRVLDVGSVHDVVVSFVEDGPLKFAVQVQSTSQILKQLMSEINSYPTAPLQEPPLPGSVCLGRYSLDKVLCRAVVMGVAEHNCKLYYVDFGHMEVLPYSEIFQLPPQYINPRVLSIRFTLSGLKDIVVTDQVKEYFKTVVSGKNLVLHVRPPEGPPLIQYGDLYENGTNVRDLISQNCPSVTAFFQEPVKLRRGAKEIVHASFVESCSKFFVQLDGSIKSLNSIMACLAEYANTAPMLDDKLLQPGSPCCACYGEDKQWYRAQILSINGDQVTVLYVDYGNEETVSASSLRKIHNNLVTNLRSQAIKCALNGFQNSGFDQELANQFELLILEKKLAMEVVDALPNISVVEIFDCNVVPMVNVASQLQIVSSPITGANLNSSIHSESGVDQNLNSSRSPDRKYQSDDRNNKWSKNGKSPNTWGGQEPRGGDWNSRRNNHESKDQLEDRMRPKNVKDVDNEQRQKEISRHEGEDRLHQKDTRNNHFNGGGNRFDRNEDSGSRRGRGGGGNRVGSGGRISRDDNNRFDKNTNKDDSWSDRDSDTSSRSSGKRGSRGPRGIKGRIERGGRRNGERKSPSGKWSDGDSDRSSQKSTQSSGFRSKDKNSTNSSWKNPKTQPNKTGSWNTMSPTSPVKESSRSQKLRIPPPNITVGAVKNVEVIYTDSPTDFYVQLCPDNLELDKLMEKIGDKYNSGGNILRKSDIHEGIFCIAQYSFDSKWYRAEVKTISPEGASVHFIDYGNSEIVGFEKIKELQPEFAKLYAQAVHCRLFCALKTEWTDNEIDEFSLDTEGISIEAEFLSQDNGVYDVLIKHVGENGAAAKYVNEKFSGGKDLIQAKEMLRNKSKGGIVRKQREIKQFIKPGEKWGDEVFDNGYQVDVVVTWFVNPNNFFCQILNKQSEFRNMMNNIQESYVEQEPIRNSLQVGDPVIAFFSDDGALYRAEIKELNKLRGHIVQYVDFGNRAMVDPCRIYPVDKRFAVLPKQAMHCSLKNVSPSATGGDWSKANKHEIDKYFDADKYKCTFHGTKDGKYLISLSTNNKDIGETMVAAGLAVDPEKCVKTVTNKVASPERLPVSKQQVEEQDLTIWTDQIIRTKVQNVQGAAKFCIQLPAGVDSKSTTVECYLPNVTPAPQIDETLRKSTEGKDVIVRIINANNKRFAVEIYDSFGKKLKFLDSDKQESVAPICPMPVTSYLVEKVWVTEIENSEEIWLQRSIDSENIAELLSSLYEYYAESGAPLVPEVGKYCVAESSDNNWYRAIVEDLKEAKAMVRFIDYGNSEEVSIESLKTLEERFFSPHQMAIKVSPVFSLKGTEEERISILHKNLDEKELNATFYNVGSKWLVELEENNVKISETLSKQNLILEFKELEPPKPEIAEMVVGKRYEVYLSHSDSPAQFWLQRNEEIDAIEAMQADLQIVAPDFPPTSGIPEEGTLCAALYSADGMWYRAEVLDADEDITTVRFIDYGNTDIVDSNSTSIKELPQSWKSVKRYGLKSRLDLIPTGSEDWSTASCEMFERLSTASSSPITALIIADSVPRRVELFLDGENSVGDALVAEGHAIMVHNAEDLIDEIIDLELDPRSAFVSHVNSPGEFWVQEEKSVSDLETMTDRFMVAEMFPKPEEIKEGTLCVAKFPDDDQWYRARVKEHSVSGTKVLYIDYGNSAVSTEVRTIPEDLAAVAPLSRKCCLKLPEGVKVWSKKACDEFLDLAADGATIFLLDVIEEGETSTVNLTLDGVNVADRLAELCDTLPVIDERLPPLGEENSPYVVVSHVNSPDEFWTQADSCIGELEIMAGRLMDAQSLLPLNKFDNGTICAAVFPEDGGWYRARILSHGDEGTCVCYFDYGSSAVTNDLRILPEDVANIPSLATRCSLKLPQDIEFWSEEASKKFNELVAEGATMFQFEIINDNDPTTVSLILDGKDVVEILKPLCKIKNLESEAENQVTEIITIEDEAELRVTEETKEQNVEVNGSIETEKPLTVSDDQMEKTEIIKESIDQSENKKETETKTGETESNAVDQVRINNVNEIEQVQMEIPDVVETEKIGDENEDQLVPEVEVASKETVLQEESVNGDEEIIPPKVEIESEEPTTENLENGPAGGEETSEKIALVLPETSVNGDKEIILPKVEIESEEPTTENLENVPAGGEETSEKIASIVEVKKEPDTLRELTVDEIVESMAKVDALDVTIEDVKADAEKPEEETEEKSVPNGIETSRKEEEKVVVDETIKDCDIETVQKTPKMDKIVPGSISRGSTEEEVVQLGVNLGRRRSSCSEERIVPGGINKGNDLEAEFDIEIVDLSAEDNRLLISAPHEINLKVETSTPVTPGKIQREEKIVPGSISRGESPTAGLARPSTPKTPHSEKLLAGVVNLQENLLPEFDEEQDEILVVEVENNIPEHPSA